MKCLPLPSQLAAGIVGCAVTVASQAMTLGDAQGLIVIGRPLDISVPALFEVVEQSGLECSDAQVYYGEVQLLQSRITTQVETARAGATVRVRAEPAVNEPFVTVYLTVGCASRLTRRFVLLSEQPEPRGDAASRRVPLAQSAIGKLLEPGKVPAARRSPLAGALTGEHPAANAVDGGTAPSAAPHRWPVQKLPRPNRDGSPENQPRLRLQALDLTALLDEPRLRMTDMMAAPVQLANGQRASTGAIWRAINARPEDLLHKVQRLEALEQDLRSLRVSIQRNEQALAHVHGQLQEAQAKRYANPVVCGLALLALVAFLVACWGWRRHRTEGLDGSQWWRPAPDSHDGSEPWREARVPATGLSGQSPLHDHKDLGKLTADRRASISDPPALTLSPQEFSSSMRSDDFRASNSASLKALRAEELHDVQQESDFFISLGEFERAIEVLRSHISMNPETSAVAWLDLMGIYHGLDRRHDYEWVRRQFQHNYNAEVPEFGDYTDASVGLESYEDAMACIVALWHSRGALEVINESVVRGPSIDGSNAFTMQAYRDLLLLRHICSEKDGQEEKQRTGFPSEEMLRISEITVTSRSQETMTYREMASRGAAADDLDTVI